MCWRVEEVIEEEAEEEEPEWKRRKIGGQLLRVLRSGEWLNDTMVNGFLATLPVEEGLRCEETFTYAVCVPVF